MPISFMPSQYRSILKSTTIFGGTQILQMIIQLIRSKFVAVLIGSAGMGLNSMYMSSLTMLITIFGLGIHISVVRDLSKANDDGDEEKFALIAKVFSRLLVFLSLLGVIFVVLASTKLSELSFGDREHTIKYIFLSLVVAFTLLQQGNNAILVGKRRIKDVAKCTLYGAIATLFTSVPFFYFFKLDGVVPGLICSTIANYLFSLYFRNRVKLALIKVTWNDIKSYGSTIVGLGFTMVIASLLGNLTVYSINIFVTRLGGLEDLGLFNAGMSLTQSIVSLVFAAMGSDYYPRLVTSSKSKELMSDTVNQQTEILVHLSVPILCIFSILSPVIISILLSEEFIAINGFIRILCFGMFFKIISYALGYVSFAKGDKVIYLFLEGGFNNVVNFLLSVGMYYYWGLTGIAYAFVLNFSLYYFIILFVDKKRYNYQTSRLTNQTIIINTAIVTAVLVLHYLLDGLLYFILTSIIAIIASYLNLKELNKKTEILQLVKQRIQR